MTRLIWNAVGERTFEVGVDHGVLYVENLDGVPWNGLISVAEAPTGGEVTPYYIDGVKYLNQPGPEEFEATIQAYTYPDEFALCEGISPVNHGLFATQQLKRSFGLSYRTKVGNDLESIEHGYKIHLVYGALAEPTERPHSSIGETIEPDNFSWHIVTKSPNFIGYKPTSHFVIDSREVPDDLLNQIEDILYGSLDEPPRLPSASELLFIFEEYQASVFDAGYLTQEQFLEFDGGDASGTLQTSTIEGGTP